MSVTIIHKKGSGIPSAESLEVAEIAVDVVTGKLYTKTDDGKVVEISGSGGGGDVDHSNYIDKTKRNDVVEGDFQILWDDSADPTYPFNGRLGYNKLEPDPNAMDGSFLYVQGTRGKFSIGRDGDVELHGPSEIQGIPDNNDERPWITGFSYVQADDFLDADGNSIIGSGGGGGGVTDVLGGTGISVDDSKPSEPVVSVDRVETDKWYLSASFTESDPTVPPHVKVITEKNITNWNQAHGWGNHASAGYLKAGDIPAGVDAYTKTESDAKYEPKFSKNTAFNKAFGTASGQVAQGNHTHSQYLTDFTESDPTVPPHVKGISQADINKWNNPPSGGGGKTYGNGNGITVDNTNDTIAMSGGYTGAFSATVSVSSEKHIGTSFYRSGGCGIAFAGSNDGKGNGWQLPANGSGTSVDSKIMLGRNDRRWTDGWFSGTVTANKVDAAMAVRSSTLTGGVVGGFYSDTDSSSTGNSNANLKSWSKTGTGKSEGFWQVAENLFAGNAFATGSSTGAANKGVSVSLAGSQLFESRGLQQYNTSGTAYNGIAVLTCMIDHGFDTLTRMTPEQEEIFKRNEEIRQQLIDNPMERVDEDCEDCWVHETADGKVALLVPVVADYDFACSSHGEFNLIKKTRSQLPDLNELFDLWRLDGKNIVVDIDQARDYAKGVLRHEARFRFCHAEADDFLFGVSRKGEMRDMVQGLMAEIDKADLGALDNLVGRLRNDGSEDYAFREYAV